MDPYLLAQKKRILKNLRKPKATKKKGIFTKLMLF